MEFLLGSAHKVSIGLPAIGLRIPRLELPWSFPAELPLSLPLTIPAQSFNSPPLAGRVSFKAISVTLTDAKLTLDVRSFKIEALQQVFEADFTLVIKDEKIDLAQSTIRVIRP